MYSSDIMAIIYSRLTEEEKRKIGKAWKGGKE